MQPISIFKSQQDQSVNFIYNSDNIGLFESRFVRREKDYFIIYLSSQSGCAQACRMCHLTASGQNLYTNALAQDFIYQANNVYHHYDKDTNKAQYVHYNFMARGEPLDNAYILQNGDKLLSLLNSLAIKRQLESRFLISTIMPKHLENVELSDIFSNADLLPEIYYSLYSVDDSFRKKWLNKALDYHSSLKKLYIWQQKTNKIPRIHFAFIEGENDSESDMYAMAKAIQEYELKVAVNIVRYNPYSPKYGRESSEEVIARNVNILKDLIQPEFIKVVPKVGFDVKASCGMFVENNI